MFTKTILPLAFLTAVALPLVAGCVADTSDVSADEAALKQDTPAASEWFYSGPIPVLEEARVTIGQKGHTARVTGYLPDGMSLPELPHVKTQERDGRTQVDIVYPIATANTAIGKSNASAGTYALTSVMPYRPDGTAYTPKEGKHFVTWGGFPFLPYDNGIALHGPITGQAAADGESVWYLRRGDVSGGCNRMMGEHVVELAHVVGISMRRLYKANGYYTDHRNVPVKVVTGYDTYVGEDGVSRSVDSDYPTDTGAVRPTGDVAMFGSWVASETPDKSDLPTPKKWEGGKSGVYYDFGQHARTDWVCDVPPSKLVALKAWAAAHRATGEDERTGELPRDFCSRRSAILGSL